MIEPRQFFANELGEDVLQYIERTNENVSYDVVDTDYVMHFEDDMIIYQTETKLWYSSVSNDVDNLKFTSFHELVEYTLSPLYKNHMMYIKRKCLNIDFESWEDQL